MNRKITVIDDDSDLRNLLQIALRLEGFEVQIYANGEEFIKSEHAATPASLYVIDINLGGIDGYEICNLLKADAKTKGSHVILISANPELPQLAMNARADDYIFKPFSQRDLMQRVSDLLGD
jgi:two-component system, OmpR family, phosphate regulon response regulator PhoB